MTQQSHSWKNKNMYPYKDLLPISLGKLLIITGNNWKQLYSPSTGKKRIKLWLILYYEILLSNKKGQHGGVSKT